MLKPGLLKFLQITQDLTEIKKNRLYQLKIPTVLKSVENSKITRICFKKYRDSSFVGEGLSSKNLKTLWNTVNHTLNKQ